MSQRVAGRPRFSLSAGLILLSVLLAAGCAPFWGGEDDPAMEEDREVTVHVKNHNWNAIHVYAIGSGQRRSLGQLATNDTATFTISESIAGTQRELRLLADPIGSRQQHVSERILFEPGDRIEWTVQNDLDQSSVMVR